jgi:hypothetical protein
MGQSKVTRTKWSRKRIEMVDAMVIVAHIKKWNVTRVLVDNGSQEEILFLSAFKQMGFDRK